MNPTDEDRKLFHDRFITPLLDEVFKGSNLRLKNILKEAINSSSTASEVDEISVIHQTGENLQTSTHSADSPTIKIENRFVWDEFCRIHDRLVCESEISQKFMNNRIIFRDLSSQCTINLPPINATPEVDIEEEAPMWVTKNLEAYNQFCFRIPSTPSYVSDGDFDEYDFTDDFDPGNESQLNEDDENYEP